MEPPPEVWQTRGYPVLRDVVRRLDAGEQYVRPADVAGSTGLDATAVLGACRALNLVHRSCS